MKRAVAASAAVVAVPVLLAIGLLALPAAGESSADEYTVYSAYLRESSTAPRHATLILAETTTAAELRGEGRWRYLLGTGWFLARRSPRPDLTLIIRFLLQNGRNHRLESRFDLEGPYDLLEALPRPNDHSVDRRIAEAAGLRTFSGVAFDLAQTHALFYTELMKCGLCGSGQFVLMEKRGPTWRVAGEHIVWIS